MKVLVMAAESNRHPDGEQLEGYSMGTVSEGEASRIEEHLLTCEECRQQLDEADAFVFSMRGAGMQARAEQGQKRQSWVFPRFAPILAAALAVPIVVLTWRSVEKRAAPPVAVTLAATRGAAGTQAPAGRPLLLKADLEGLPSLPAYHLEMVDHVGRPVWQSTLDATIVRNGATASPAPPGIYFVRVSTPAGVLLREYALSLADQP